MAINPVALEVITLCLGILLLLLESFWTGFDKKGLAYAGITGLAFILVMSFFVSPDRINPDSAVGLLYATDGVAMYFKQFALVATIFVLILALDYADTVLRFVPSSGGQAGLGEFFILPIFACAGLMWMASAQDFIMIFVSLELVTISFYVMVAYMRRSSQSLEAGVKYLILGALSTGFLVYGITWIFGLTGQTNLGMLKQILPVLSQASEPAMLFGIGLVLVALGFKIAAVPFQFWVPDVYQGAATPITAFLSVASKAAGFVVLLRVLEPFMVVPDLRDKLIAILGVLAGATLIMGNLAALPQTNMKRLLSYSSIAHAGYLLVGVASVGAVISGPAVMVYLSAYLLMTFLAFLVLVLVAKHSGGDDISHFNGLAQRSPFLAFAMLIAMVSLAGLPLTAGFIGKFMIFAAAVDQQHYWLVAIGAVAVACGFYYYIKVVKAMYWRPAADGASAIPISRISSVAMILLIALIFVLGVYPKPILDLLRLG